MVEKMIKISQIFFFQKIDTKKRSKTQFHKNRPKIRDFRLKLARHENFTAPENGGNSSSLLQGLNI